VAYLNVEPLRLSDVESGAFQSIMKRLESHHPDVAEPIKELVFCVAYALYKRQKLVIGGNLKGEEGAKPPRDICSDLNGILNTEEMYDQYINDAKSKIVALTDATSNKILTEMSGAFYAQVESLIQPVIVSNPKSRLEVLLEFIYHSFLHALHIVVAALMIYLIAILIVSVGPLVGGFFMDLGEKYLGDVLDTFQK
jgi:hypothetical protein